jgi:hypothetical protein
MAVGDRSESRMVGPVALSTSNALITGATVPASRQWIIKQVTVCNTSGTEALVYLAIGSANTPSNRFMSGVPVAANDVLVFDTGIVMSATEQLYGYSDYSGVNVIVNGWVKEV